MYLASPETLTQLYAPNITAIHHDQFTDRNPPLAPILSTDWATDPSPNIYNQNNVCNQLIDEFSRRHDNFRCVVCVVGK